MSNTEDKNPTEVVLPSTGMTTTTGSDPSHPSNPAPRPHSQFHSHSRAHIGDEKKHAEAHILDSPPGMTDREPVNPSSDGNTNLHSDGRAHEDEHSIHSADIPPPSPFRSAAAHRDHPVQGANIPLPPSHTNSFAPGVTPLTPDEQGDRSTGYQAIGGMPTPAGQGHGQGLELGLGPGPGPGYGTGIGVGVGGGEKAGIIGIGGTMGRSENTTRTAQGAHHAHNRTDKDKELNKEEERKGNIKSHVPGMEGHELKKTFEGGPDTTTELGQGSGIGIGSESGSRSGEGANIGLGLDQGGVADRSLFPPETGTRTLSSSHHDEESHSLKHDHDHDHEHEYEERNGEDNLPTGPAFTPADIGSSHEHEHAKAEEPVKEKIAESVPGTAAHKEKKEETALAADAEKDI
ncbi:hypothetical protein IAT40_003503 [Kwoniella sp. CBS 6097]